MLLSLSSFFCLKLFKYSWSKDYMEIRVVACLIEMFLIHQKRKGLQDYLNFYGIEAYITNFDFFF